VADVHDDGVNKQAPSSVYWPIIGRRFWGNEVDVRRTFVLAIRSSRAGSESFLNEIQRAVWSVDSNLPLADVHTLEYFYTKSMARTSFTLVMLALAAAVALLLGIVGLYGVMSYSVSHRTRDIGIRMALGAEPRNVLSLILRHGFKLTLIGIVTGIGGALALTRFMTTLLYGVKPADPLTLGPVSLILSAVALVASYIPARRATKVDPTVALRYE
jgi:ABC-type antimicrobial peptide transport system permease subunit